MTTVRSGYAKGMGSLLGRPTESVQQGPRHSHRRYVAPFCNHSASQERAFKATYQAAFGLRRHPFIGERATKGGTALADRPRRAAPCNATNVEININGGTCSRIPWAIWQKRNREAETGGRLNEPFQTRRKSVLGTQSDSDDVSVACRPLLRSGT